MPILIHMSTAVLADDDTESIRDVGDNACGRSSRAQEVTRHQWRT